MVEYYPPSGQPHRAQTAKGKTTLSISIKHGIGNHEAHNS